MKYTLILSVTAILASTVISPLLTYASENEKADSITQNNDIMLYYGMIDYSAEFYQVNRQTRFVEHHFLYQPLLNDKNILNIEFGVVQTSLEDGRFTVPADMKIGYRRNFKSKAQLENGYDGSFVGANLTLPTGRDEYYSGFDSWTIEPIAGFQWKLWNPNTLTGLKLMYNYSFAALPGKTPRFSFLRILPSTGFENNRFWAFVSLDIRFIPSRGESNLFLATDLGFKFTEKLGIYGKFKPRIVGDSFFEELNQIGLYFYL